MKSLFDTLNIVYGEKEKRGFFKLNAMSLIFTLAAIAFVLAALGALVVLPVVLNYLWLSNFADLFLRIVRLAGHVPGRGAGPRIDLPLRT